MAGFPLVRQGWPCDVCGTKTTYGPSCRGCETKIIEMWYRIDAEPILVVLDSLFPFAPQP